MISLAIERTIWTEPEQGMWCYQHMATNPNPFDRQDTVRTDNGKSLRGVGEDAQMVITVALLFLAAFILLAVWSSR